ncbi:MAG: RlmE family RNA methyltransferase [Phycisphaeraceae bacterium]|nr:RlmE family RNA methyltransferase [Phycisphaeraceae bacterium]MCB9847062.1 RlmE family RNA methyltransferase [Phycisphaeraceae bacterium]
MARRTLHDRYYKQAKAEGYVARSAYKLLEINQKKRLIRKGDRVLDLGCAPGAWVQVALEIVGPGGSVVGLDLQRVRHGFGENAVTIEGDAEQIEASRLTGAGVAEPRLFDCVLSDMAPSTGGGAGGSGDHFLSVRLCEAVLGLTPGVLKPGGNVAMKVFEGEAYKGLLDRTAGMFEKVKGFKPSASRDASREIYIVAHGFRKS